MNKKNVDLAGINIYLNTSGNTVYYNVFDKNGYIVSNKIEQKFKLLYYRHFIIVALLVLLGDYFSTFENTLLVGVIASITIEVYFRTIFLKKMKISKKFKRDKKVSKVENIIKSDEKEKIIMKSCAYIVLSILIAINAIQENYSFVFMILNVLIIIYSLYSVVINFIAFRKMNSR